ncbi:MAG: hypothetical protein U9R65_12545 [Pseudomonadota bacterium]|nr:hypothetical protein [Pseudomonadota bacterium]
MRVPELVYQFQRPLDAAGPTFELYQRELAATFNGVQVRAALSNVPKDRVLVISNVHVRSVRGGVVGITRIVINGTTNAGRVITIKNVDFVPAVGGSANLDWQGEVQLLGGGPLISTIFADTFFDAANAANGTTISVFGIMIPRGNIAQA